MDRKETGRQKETEKQRERERERERERDREREIEERETWGDGEDGEQREGERTIEHTRETRKRGRRRKGRGQCRRTEPEALKFGETVQYMLPTVKQFPKLEPRIYNGIWLGKDTTTGESLIGIYNKIGRARTIRRQIMPHKYNQQLLDCIHTGPWKTPASALPTPTLTAPVTLPAAVKAPTSHKDATTTSTASEGKRQSTTQSSDQQPKQKRTAGSTSPMATSPTHQKRPALLHHKGKTALKTTSLCKKPPKKTLQKQGFGWASRSL